VGPNPTETVVAPLAGIAVSRVPQCGDNGHLRECISPPVNWVTLLMEGRKSFQTTWRETLSATEKRSGQCNKFIGGVVSQKFFTHKT
jgi:hypothetical protein